MPRSASSLAREPREHGRDSQPVEVVERLAPATPGAPPPRACNPEAEAQKLARPRAPRSRTRSAPVMPQSTTPSWTYSGMSAARTSSTSTGALRHGNASARSPGTSGPSPASSSSVTGGLAQPALGRDRDLQACVERRLLPVDRQPVAPFAVAEPVRHPRHRRRRGARPPATPRDRAGPRPPAAPPASGAPSPRAPRACRDPEGSAPPRPPSRGSGSPRIALSISVFATLVLCMLDSAAAVAM